MIGADNRGRLWKSFGWLLIPLFAIGFFWQPIMRGQVLIPGDIIGLVDPVWSSTVRPQNALLSDVVFQFYPWQQFLFDRVRHGELPLWNPRQLAGTPFLANDQSAIFDPIRWLTLAVGWNAAQSFLPMEIVRLSLFGLGTWLFLRRRHLSPTASILAGVTAMVAVPTLAWLSYPLFAALAWAPLMFYAIDGLRNNARSGVFFLAVATAGQFLSGNIQISLFLVLASCTFVFFGQKLSWSVVTRFLLGLMLGAMVAAIQLLPTWSFVRQSNQFELGRRGYATTSFMTALKDGKWIGWTSRHEIRTNIEKALPFLAPTIHGSPTSNNYRFVAGDPNNNYNELASSVGVIGLILALVGLITSWRERLVRWMAGFSVVCFGIIVHAPVFELVNYLPVINRTDTERLRLLVAWALVVLAAYGMQALISRHESRVRRLVVIVTIMIVSLYGLVMLADGPKPIPKTEVALVILSGLALVAGHLIKKNWLRVGLIALAVVLVPVATLRTYNPSVSADTLFPANDITNAVRQAIGHDGRVVGFLSAGSHAPLRPNSALVTGLDDIRGYEVVRLARFDTLTQGVLKKSGSYVMNISGYSPILDILSVRAVLMTDADVTKHAQEFLDRGWIDIGDTQGLHVLSNPHALPRAYFVTSVTQVTTATEGFWLVTSPTWNTQAPVLETGKSIVAAGEPNVIPAQILNRSANTLSVHVDAPQSGWLMVSDAYTPDWQVFVDGRKGKVIPADYALRAVTVPAGGHVVVWRYKPRAFSIGLWLTIAGLVVTTMVGLWTLRQTKQPGLSDGPKT
ncbi:MAG: YfhO family protein [Candidatus Kerfeldbacteria bacterium]|nr:YfhO family protein [Candidatus Kerfeldbacteria bacterium]